MESITSGFVQAFQLLATMDPEVLEISFRTLQVSGIATLISVLIGMVIAGGLSLWHRLHPIKEPQVENKRPLGLD